LLLFIQYTKKRANDNRRLKPSDETTRKQITGKLWNTDKNYSGSSQKSKGDYIAVLEKKGF
jgi:hypothetical protein